MFFSSSSPHKHFDVGIAPEGDDHEEENDHDPDRAYGVEIIVLVVVTHVANSKLRKVAEDGSAL